MADSLQQLADLLMRAGDGKRTLGQGEIGTLYGLACIALHERASVPETLRFTTPRPDDSLEAGKWRDVEDILGEAQTFLLGTCDGDLRKCDITGCASNAPFASTTRN